MYTLSWYAAVNIRKLAADGWVFYHVSWCGYCVKQIEQIGASKFSWMPMVECSNNPVCVDKGITSFPTWLNERTGQKHTGSIDLDPITMDDTVLLDVLGNADIKKVISVKVDEKHVFN